METPEYRTGFGLFWISLFLFQEPVHFEEAKKVKNYKILVIQVVEKWV